MSQYSTQRRDAIEHRASGTLSVPSSVTPLLKNTYLLLSMTLFFSAIVAWVSASMHVAPMGLMSLIFMFGLLFALNKAKNSIWALPLVFLFTGFMGYTLGPIIDLYTNTAAGSALLIQALVGTGVTFCALSGYALTTKKDFNFLKGFLFAGLVVSFLAIIANIFLEMPALNLVISVISVLVASGLILFDTSRIVNGGETNYVMATVSLYLDIYMLFVHLLNLLSAFNRD